MRIALIFPGCHKRAGVERIVWETAKAFSTTDEVVVIASEIDVDGLAGVTVRHVPQGASLRFAQRARKLYSTSEFDHVISFGAQALPADVLWVSSVHRAWLQASREFPELNGLARHPALRYALPRHFLRLGVERRYFHSDLAKVVITVSDVVAKDLSRLYNTPPSSMHTLNNGYDPAEFRPEHDPEVVARTRAGLGIPRDAPLICMAANELLRKGYATTLDALASSELTGVHFLLVGRSDPARFTDQISSLRLTGRVHYGGLRKDMGAVLAAADLFVLPTTYEAFCLAIVEALACGLPVITTQVPGAADLIQDGKNGFLLANPRDSIGLADLIAKALNGNVAQLRANAAASVSHLTWQSIMASARELLLA